MMENRKKANPTSLKDIIAGIFQDSSLPFNPEDGRIWLVWEEAVGPAVAKNARPSWIKDGKLRVNVLNSIWMQELNFQEEAIRKKLNGKLGREAVKIIQFRLGA